MWYYFLIKLFSFLDFNTGYDRNNYKNSIFSNCNSGMEKKNYKENYNIIKNPYFIYDIENIAQDTSITIKYVIIPIRNLQLSAKSRLNHGKNAGGVMVCQ